MYVYCFRQRPLFPSFFGRKGLELVSSKWTDASRKRFGGHSGPIGFWGAWALVRSLASDIIIFIIIMIIMGSIITMSSNRGGNNMMGISHCFSLTRAVECHFETWISIKQPPPGVAGPHLRVRSVCFWQKRHPRWSHYWYTPKAPESEAVFVSPTESEGVTRWESFDQMGENYNNLPFEVWWSVKFDMVKARKIFGTLEKDRCCRCLTVRGMSCSFFILAWCVILRSFTFWKPWDPLTSAEFNWRRMNIRSTA